MGSVLSIIISSFIILGSLFPSVTDSNTGWSYLQSDQQTFYIFIDYISMTDQSGNMIDGYGDGSGTTNSSGNEDCMQDPSACDVLGAFISHDITEDACLNTAEGIYENGVCEVCVGWIYYNSYSTTSTGTIATTLPIMGQTSSQDPIYDFYCSNNESPHLKFHDSSEDATYSLTTESDLGAFFNNNIFVYYPDCSEIQEDCEEMMFLAQGSQDLDNNENLGVPESFEVISIYPNPFNPSTKLSYTLNSIDNISITVFDTLGNEMETLFDGYQGIGYHDISWVPAYHVPSGSYLIKISTSNNSIINKVTYIK